MLKTISGVTVKDADKGEVSAVFCTFNVVDKDGDLIEPGAIKDGTEVVISSYGHGSHGYMGGRLPVGKGVIRTTKTEAVIDATFFMDTTHGADTFKTVKNLGPLQEWSFSLHNVTRKSADVDGQYVSIIESVGLIKEVSPVLIGAGVNTRTLVAKGALILNDQIKAAMDVVADLVESAERVVALRAEQGKSLSNVNAEGLGGLCAEVDRLKALLTADSASADEATPEDIKAIAAEQQRSVLFSNLSN